MSDKMSTQEMIDQTKLAVALMNRIVSAKPNTEPDNVSSSEPKARSNNTDFTLSTLLISQKGQK